jgi:hypothetical protein
MSFVVAAQLSTSGIPSGLATAEWVWRAIDRVTDILPLDILIVGGSEAPEIFRNVTARASRPTRQVFLWYYLLADFPGSAPADQVISWRGVPPEGWGDDEIENFRFGCPNNPAVRRKTLDGLARLVDKYPFDGVFLDKLRFPSPANGLDGLFTCFCKYCTQRAAETGLDLDAVRSALERFPHTGNGTGRPSLPPGAPWLEDLLSQQPLLRAFARFRADSVTSLVEEASAVARRAGLSTALDLFSPVLAPLVGQDYPVLAAGAAWVKPMTYRLTDAPAGLRLELPALAGMLGAHLHRGPDEVLQWARSRIPGLGSANLRDVSVSGVPLELVAHDLESAVRLSAPTPVYMGLETVSIPDVCEATPATVAQAIAAGQRAGVAGLVMSWDLLDTPLENVRAVADALSQD